MRIYQPSFASRRLLMKAVLLCLLILSFTLLTKAQSQNNSPQRGFHAGGSYALSEIETLSQFSGEVSLRIPLGSLPPGRGGLSARLNLLYGSKLWDTFETTDYTPWGEPHDASRLKLNEEGEAGWRYGYQYRLKINYLRVGDQQGYCDSQPGTDHPYQLALVTPDGGQHKLWLDGHSDSTGFMDVWPGFGAFERAVLYKRNVRRFFAKKE